MMFRVAIIVFAALFCLLGSSKALSGAEYYLYPTVASSAATLRLALFPSHSISPDDSFVSDCDNDTVLNVYLADMMRGQSSCYMADCLSQKNLTQAPFILEAPDHVRLALASLFDVIFNSDTCSFDLANNFAAINSAINSFSDDLVEINVIETSKRLEEFPIQVSHCPKRKERLIINLVIPDFCGSACFKFCYNQFTNLKFLNEAILSYEIKQTKKKIQNLIDILLEQQQELLRTFDLSTPSINYGDQAVDTRDFVENGVDSFLIGIGLLNDISARS